MTDMHLKVLRSKAFDVFDIFKDGHLHKVKQITEAWHQEMDEL